MCLILVYTILHIMSKHLRYVVVLYLLIQLNSSDLQFCNQYSVPKDKLDHFKDITAQDIVCSQVHVYFTHLSWVLWPNLFEILQVHCRIFPVFRNLPRCCWRKKMSRSAMLRLIWRMGWTTPLKGFLVLEHSVRLCNLILGIFQVLTNYFFPGMRNDHSAESSSSR